MKTTIRLNGMMLLNYVVPKYSVTVISFRIPDIIRLIKRYAVLWQ